MKPDQETIFARACYRLDIDPEAVLSWKVYKDHIALVVDCGVKGCPKVKVPLSDLREPELDEDDLASTPEPEQPDPDAVGPVLEPEPGPGPQPEPKQPSRRRSRKAKP